MFHPKLFATLSVGLIAAACAGPYDQQASTPRHYASSNSERNCVDYGFTPGSGAYDRCVQRESSARSVGRMNRDYAEARLGDDSRNACYGYGLEPGTTRYDNCVAREVDARRYREQGQAPAPRQVYVPAYEPAPSTVYYTGPRNATNGVDNFHDEFGFRYDAQGNRLDRNGRFISPQSTTP